MKRITSYILAMFLTIFTIEVGLSQNINLELADPHPVLQDADVGDMEFADIDNDGDNDLIMIGKGGPILTTIYTNDGNGNFSESNNTELVNVFDGTIGLNDVDEDGDLDLLITGSKSSIPSVNLYLNDGAGIFSPTTTTLSPSAAGGDFAFGDVDNDDDDDLILTGASTPSGGNIFTKLYLNNGSGTFSESTSNNFEQLNSRVEFFDCDGDGDLDLLVSGYNATIDRRTILYINDGSGNFTEETNTAFENMAGGDIAIGDSDNDGDMDVLICGDTETVTVTELYLNDGTGDFTLLQNTDFSVVSLGEVSFHDFDNDDDLDVFVLGTGPGGLINDAIVGNVYENLGANTFVISDSLIGAYFSSHSVADIDGDNDLDLVLGGTTIGTPPRATWLYTNETTITVSTPELSQAVFQPIEIYPNPFQEVLHINLGRDRKAIIQMYSAMGNLVYSKITYSENPKINLDLPVGNYTIRIVTKENNHIQKIISIR